LHRQVAMLRALYEFVMLSGTPVLMHPTNVKVQPAGQLPLPSCGLLVPRVINDKERHRQLRARSQSPELFQTVVDIYTRECLAIESEQRLAGEDVAKGSVERLDEGIVGGLPGSGKRDSHSVLVRPTDPSLDWRIRSRRQSTASSELHGVA
jgi:hypothetical protein